MLTKTEVCNTRHIAGHRHHLDTLRCRCDHRSPPIRIIRSVEFNGELSGKISALNLSGDATVDFVLTELLDRHAGRLFGPDGEPVELDTDNPIEIARFDALFSEDQRRFVNRYKERAGNGEFRYRLQERLVFPIMMMHFAMTIRECRLSGNCAMR